MYSNYLPYDYILTWILISTPILYTILFVIGYILIFKRFFIKFINIIKASKKNYEIIIVDNNSTDGTIQKLRELKKKNVYKNIRFIFNKNNLGKGGSVKKACKISKGKYCCIFDIDECYAKKLKKIYKKVIVIN